MKKFLILLLAFTIILSLASCKDKENNENVCDGHVDADDDYLCDKCGENYDDGDEAPDLAEPTKYEITFELVLDNGDAVSGVKFTITRGARTFELVSGADGIAKQSLEEGPYAIEYDYDTLPEYCTPDTFGFKVEEGMTKVTLVITNNTPDGTAEKPFLIVDNDTEITIEPGQSIYYAYRGTTVKTLTINAEGVSVNYNGDTYSSEDGVISLQFNPEIGKQIIFSVNNTTDSKITTVMSIVALPGSSENPFELEGTSGVASVSEEHIVYYKWVADKDGVLVVRSSSSFNNISLTKVLENDILIIAQTAGDAAAYLVINAGDEISIGVSAINTADKVDVDFSISSYAGTESDPVPVLMDEIDISLSPNQSIIFSVEVGKTLRITDENRVSVWHDTITFTNEGDVEIVVELVKPIFVLNNYSEFVNGITINFN